MARYAPRSQTRLVMQQKEAVAKQLLARGLTIYQIRAQLQCSYTFLRRIRDEGQL